MNDLHANSVAHAHDAFDSVTLDYDARLLRRKRLATDGGRHVLVDLAETRSLNHGDCLVLTDGRHVKIVAAPEDLVAVKASDLLRMAWHIGNRHTPCQIEPDRLLILRDHVLEAMLAQLGADVEIVTEPFTPEGGAYGHGRTFGHDHGPLEHASHTHDHGSHTHSHD